MFNSAVTALGIVDCESNTRTETLQNCYDYIFIKLKCRKFIQPEEKL